MITLQQQIAKVRQWANYTEPDDAEVLEAAAKSLETLAHLLEAEKLKSESQRKKAPIHPFWAKYIEAHKIFLQNQKIVQRMNVAEGKALKEIIQYLEEYTNGDQDKAFAAWLMIFQRWGQLNSFLKSQNTMLSINKYLQEIITKLTHGANPTQHNKQAASDLANRVRTRREATFGTA